CRRPDHPWGQPPAMLRAMRRALGSDSRKVLNDFALACLAPGEAAFREEAAAGFDYQAAPAFLAQGLDYLRDKDLRGLLPIDPKTSSLGGRGAYPLPHPGRGGQRHLEGSAQGSRSMSWTRPAPAAQKLGRPRLEACGRESGNREPLR